MFIGRIKEKKDILSHLLTSKMEYLLVYGIRRVGKTRLINECLKNVNSKIIYYTFRDVPTNVNVNEFANYLPTCFNESYLSFDNIKNSLIYLCEKAKKESIILFIDEYSFLRRDDAGIDSYFQDIMNQYGEESNLKIIFCGSYTSIMLKMIDSDAPLYGRFSYILNLLPFDYYESSLFMNNISNEDKFKYYACFGGLGFTLSNLDFNKSFEDNLKDLLIENNSLFEREILSIINQEINKIPEAKYLLELIARKINKYSDINREFRKINSGNSIAYYLNKLQELSLIEKVSDINENKTKNDLYFIKDNLLDFYFTYLSRNTMKRMVMSSDSFLNEIKEDLDTKYLPRKFEDVTKQFLIKLNKEKTNDNYFEMIGRLIYHDKINDKNGEFDVCIKDERGYMDIECKYINRLVSFKDYKKEIEQLKTLKLNNIRVGFVSKNGFDETYPIDMLHYQLDDFYDLFNKVN